MQDKKSVFLIGAVLAALLSLPMTWMTLRGAQLQGGPGMMFNSAFGGLTIDVTGLNGYVTFLVKTPIWFIVCVSAAASTLQLLRRQKKVDIPAGLEWGTAVLAVIWVGIAVCVALFSGQASLGLGAILGVISAGVPLACLISSLNEPLNDESGLETDSENQV